MPAAAQFSMDKSADEIRIAMQRPAISDLAVGEVGLKSRPYFCSKGNELFILGNTLLDTKESSYGTNYKLKRLPGNSVSLTVTMVKSLNDTTLDGEIAMDLLGASLIDCNRPVTADQLQLKVLDINGKSNVSDFISF